MSDQFLNDYFLCYMEKELFGIITNDIVIMCFQNIRNHREQL